MFQNAETYRTLLFDKDFTQAPLTLLFFPSNCMIEAKQIHFPHIFLEMARFFLKVFPKRKVLYKTNLELS